MAEVTIVYWRDIPAQVLAGRGRGGAKAQLPGRFEASIDRAAMRAGLADTDDYLAQWRKAAEPAPGDTPQQAADAAAARIDADYDTARLRDIIENGGWDSSSD